MSQANVRSVEAISDFRAALATFAEVVKQVLDEVDIELRRAMEWVGEEQPAFWKNEVPRSWDLVAQRRNELEQCERKAYDGQRPSCFQERKALEAAKRYVRYVEEKLAVMRRWGRKVQEEVSEYQGRAGQMRMRLEAQLPRALALLDRMIAALESYAAIGAPAAPPGTGPTSAARPDGETAPAEPISPYHQLRDLTPDEVKRRAALRRESLADQGQRPPADPAQAEQAAVKLAVELQQQPQWPDWLARVVIAAGCLEEEDVYLQRFAVHEDPSGRHDESGWYIGAAQQNLGEEPELEAITLGDLLQQRPALLAAMALPPGFLAVFHGEDLVAVVNEAGIEVARKAADGEA